MLLAVPHATLPYECTGDVAVGEQTRRLKKKKKKSQSGETAEQTKERLHPDAIATASLHEKQEEGGESNAEKQEAFSFSGHRAALVHAGNFPSESQAVLESWQEVLLRQTWRSGDLPAPGQVRNSALGFWCAKLRMFFLFSLSFLSPGVLYPCSASTWWLQCSHHLALLTTRISQGL